MSERVVLKNYFTPVDQFLEKVMVKYDSLAMTCPRIHTPFDLVRWSEIKSDIGKQFDFFRDVKDFYLTYLQDESLSNFNYFFSQGHVNTIYDARGIHKTLTSHAPVFGKWMKNSGLLKNINQKDVQDLNNYVEKYDDFKKIFDKEGISVNKKRDCLFPTFDAAVTKNIFLNKGICKTSYDFITTKEKVHVTDGGWETYVEREKAFFSVIPTDYDLTNISETAIPIIEDSNEKTTVLMRINDYYKKRNREEEEGFLGSDIRAAYHMNFDLHARFKSIKNIESPIQSEFSYKRIRDINDRLEDDNVVIGRILKRHEYSCKDHNMTYHKGSFEGDYLIQKWDHLPIFIQDSDVYDRKNCVYGNFEDYFNYDNTISEITRKFNTNYFAFMYGALPVNNLTYEDIRSGLGHNSVINLDNSQGNFTVEKRKRINWRITELPSKEEVEHYKKISESAIRFLALVFGISGEKYKLKLYYLDDEGVQSPPRDFNTLSRPYPYFLISETKSEENENQSNKKKDNMTQTQKDDLKNKMVKIIGDWKAKSSFDREDIIFMVNNISRIHRISNQDKGDLQNFKDKLVENENLDDKDKGILSAIAGRISLGGGDSSSAKKEDKAPGNDGKQSEPNDKKPEDKQQSEDESKLRQLFNKLKKEGDRNKITKEEMGKFFKIDWPDDPFKAVKERMGPIFKLEPDARNEKDEWKKFMEVLDKNKNLPFPGVRTRENQKQKQKQKKG